MPQYDLIHMPTIFKDNIKNCFEAVDLIDQEPQEQGNEINIAKDEYENRLSKLMKEKKRKWMSD